MNPIEVLEIRIATMAKGKYRDALIKRREILKWIQDAKQQSNQAMQPALWASD